jgi:CheY-like chemotaxis protein
VRGTSVGGVAGHGIGLWLARQLVENMSGNLVLAPPDRPFTGARFVLSVPLPASNRAHGVDSLPETGPKRVILIEDEPLSRDVLQRMLALDGHEVLAFESGEAALETLASQGGRHDLALVDGNMPGLNGLETAKRLRALDSLGPLTIVLMTAHVIEEHIQAQKQGVADLVIQKPCNLETLRRLLGDTAGVVHHFPDATNGAGSASKSGVSAQPGFGGSETRSRADVSAMIGQMGETARPYFNAYLDAIQTSLSQCDWTGLEAHAHKLAGAALMQGLNDVGATALALEESAKGKDALKSGALVDRLSALYRLQDL